MIRSWSRGSSGKWTLWIRRAPVSGPARFRPELEWLEGRVLPAATGPVSPATVNDSALEASDLQQDADEQDDSDTGAVGQSTDAVASAATVVLSQAANPETRFSIMNKWWRLPTQKIKLPGLASQIGDEDEDEDSPFQGPDKVFLTYTANLNIIPLTEPHSGSGGAVMSSGGTEETGPSIFERTFQGDNPAPPTNGRSALDVVGGREQLDGSRASESNATAAPDPSRTRLAPLSRQSEATVAPLLSGPSREETRSAAKPAFNFLKLFDDALRTPPAPNTSPRHVPARETSNGAPEVKALPQRIPFAADSEHVASPALIDAYFHQPFAPEASGAAAWVLATALGGDMLRVKRFSKRGEPCLPVTVPNRNASSSSSA